jgi:hypothetical protein
MTRAAVYRLDVETWSDKQKEVAHDFPGAYPLPSLTVPFPHRTRQEA